MSCRTSTMPYFLTSNYNLNSPRGTLNISVKIELQYVRVCFCVRALKLAPDCCLFHLSALKKQSVLGFLNKGFYWHNFQQSVKQAYFLIHNYSQGHLKTWSIKGFPLQGRSSNASLMPPQLRLSVLWPLTTHTEVAVIRTEAQTVLRTLFSTHTACNIMPCVNTSSAVSGVFVWPIMLLLVLYLCPNTCQEPPACLLLLLPHAPSLYSAKFDSSPNSERKSQENSTDLEFDLVQNTHDNLLNHRGCFLSWLLLLQTGLVMLVLAAFSFSPCHSYTSQRGTHNPEKPFC